MTDTNTDLFHIMYTCRSMRRLKPDPVPDEVIYQILDAGIRAPSGGGVQAWRFMVVTDPDIRRQIAAVYQRGLGYCGEALSGSRGRDGREYASGEISV